MPAENDAGYNSSVRAWTLAAAWLIFLPISSAQAEDLEVAVVLDTSQMQLQRPATSKALSGANAPSGGFIPLTAGPGSSLVEASPEVRRALQSFEASLRKASESTSLALLYCRRAADGSEQTQLQDLSRGWRELGARLELGQGGGCPATVDRVLEAVERLHWSAHSRKRILVIGRRAGLFTPGRTTLEDVAHRAEQRGIVLHAAELVDAGDWSFESEIADLGADVRAFLEKPSLPLGRVPTLPRHATLLSGGSFEVIVVPGYRSIGWWPRAFDQGASKEVRRRRSLAADVQHLRKRTGVAVAFGALSEGRDGLDALAEGSRRPSELTPASLPEAVRGQALEPLLDAIWDFVDARRVTASALNDLENEVDGSAAVGERLAAAVRGPRRLPPSRR